MVRPATMFGSVTSNEELYQLRKDLSGTGTRGIAREKRPQAFMREKRVRCTCWFATREVGFEGPDTRLVLEQQSVL